MKPIYTLILSALFIGNSYGQAPHLPEVPMEPSKADTSDVSPSFQEVLMKPSKADINDVSHSTTDFISADRQNPFDTIWYEDFSTDISDWTQDGVHQAWRRTKTGSTGPFNSGVGVINSPTKANGFIIFDADSFNYANHPSTPPNGAGYEELSGFLISPSINCSSKPGVIVNFNQFFRLCCDPQTTSLILSVSNDDGLIWTDFDCIGTTNIGDYNQSNLVPSVPTSINISSVAANQANVKLKFTFSAMAYMWQIDDILLTESPNNDVINQKSIPDFAYVDGGYYTITPRAQVAPITFRTAIFNNGSTTQTNVVANVNVSNGSTSVFSQNSNTLASFNPLAYDTLEVTTPFTPAGSTAANYTVTFTVNQSQTDEVPANNAITKTFAVSDTVYARDNGVTTTADVGPGDYDGGEVDGAAIANVYEFPAAAVASSVSVFIDADTDLGTSISAGIWDANGATVAVAPDVESDIYDIASNANKNKWVTLPLISPYTLDANGTYRVGIRTWGVSSSAEVLVRRDLTTQQPDLTTRILVGSPLAWAWIKQLPAIRLNILAPDAGKNEIAAGGVKLFQNMPNPFSNSTLINYEIAKNENITLDVFDMTGKKVVSIAEGNKAVGTHTIEIAEALKPGVYFYTLKAGDYSLTKKMTVLK